MVFLDKGYEPWHGSCYISKHTFGSHSRDRKKMSPSNSDSHGNQKIFLAHVPLKEAPSFLSLPLLSEPSSPFLLILMAHYSHLSSISVVLQNCKAHFHVGCLCLEPLKKKNSLLLMVGCLLCSSLLIWLSWKCTFSGRGSFLSCLEVFKLEREAGPGVPCLRDLISRADAVAWG